MLIKDGVVPLHLEEHSASTMAEIKEIIDCRVQALAEEMPEAFFQNPSFFRRY